MDRPSLTGFFPALVDLVKHYGIKINHIIGVVMLFALYLGNPSRAEHEGYVRLYLEKSGAPSTSIFYKSWFFYSVVYRPKFGCIGHTIINLGNSGTEIITCSPAHVDEIDYRNMQPLTYGFLWNIFETDAFVLLQNSGK